MEEKLISYEIMYRNNSETFGYSNISIIKPCGIFPTATSFYGFNANMVFIKSSDFTDYNGPSDLEEYCSYIFLVENRLNYKMLQLYDHVKNSEALIEYDNDIIQYVKIFDEEDNRVSKMRHQLGLK